MPRSISVGDEFTRLTVLRPAPHDGYGPRWECQCSCGEVVVVSAQCLYVGDTKSCGCLRREHAARLGKEWKGSRRDGSRGVRKLAGRS